MELRRTRADFSQRGEICAAHLHRDQIRMCLREAGIVAAIQHPARPREIVVKKGAIRETPARFAKEKLELLVVQRAPTGQGELKNTKAQLAANLDPFDDGAERKRNDADHRARLVTHFRSKGAHDLPELRVAHRVAFAGRAEYVQAWRQLVAQPANGRAKQILIERIAFSPGHRTGGEQHGRKTGGRHVGDHAASRACAVAR